jgi:CNT family concentrative nucleoside transporter
MAFRSFLGLLALLGACWAMSRNRSAIQWRLVGWGIALQLVFGILVLRTPIGTGVFGGVNDVLQQVMKFSEAGGAFLFGDLIFNNVPIGTGTAGGNGALTAVRPSYSSRH